MSKNKSHLYFVTNKGVKDKFITRVFCSMFNCIYVDSELDNIATNIKAIKKCLEVLKNGNILVIFPEGVILPQKEVFFEFSRSFVFLARKAKSKIYPLYIYPELRLFKRSIIYINEEVSYTSLTGDDLVDSIRIESIIMEASSKVRDS